MKLIAIFYIFTKCIQYRVAVEGLLYRQMTYLQISGLVRSVKTPNKLLKWTLNSWLAFVPHTF